MAASRLIQVEAQRLLVYESEKQKHEWYGALDCGAVWGSARSLAKIQSVNLAVSGELKRLLLIKFERMFPFSRELHLLR